MYARVWEYHVGADRTSEFLAAYGAEGDWSALFRRSRGYVGTELYRDTHDTARFLTVDRWSSEADWTTFLQEHRESYGALDERTASLSLAQRELVAGTGPPV